MADKKVPETRQCQEQGHWQFGTIAVAAGKNRWGAMSPNNGGHWATDDEVKEWKVVT